MRRTLLGGPLKWQCQCVGGRRSVRPQRRASCLCLPQHSLLFAAAVALHVAEVELEADVAAADIRIF